MSSCCSILEKTKHGTNPTLGSFGQCRVESSSCQHDLSQAWVLLADLVIYIYTQDIPEFQPVRIMAVNPASHRQHAGAELAS